MPAPLLQMHHIDKSFPGVHALNRVNLELRRGEVLALLGENGAGKSTLIKILGGAHQPDSGEIMLEGETVQITQPADAQRLGIAIIYQEFNLVPHLSARANLFLGQERTTGGFLRSRDEHRRARELLGRLGVSFDPETPCHRLTVAQQQIVEIAKALLTEARIIVMDEPTATLTPQEVERLFAVIRELRAQGIGIIYISHRLAEIEAIADRITVLRDGTHVGSFAAAEVDRRTLIERMVGRHIEQEFPKERGDIGEQRLVVRHLSRGDRVRDVSFAVRRGEVLAITGLVGAGRTELARLIFGADRRDGGTIELDGRVLRIRSPRDAIRAGICLLTEDRKSQGLVTMRSVRENFALPNMKDFAPGTFLRRRLERERLEHFRGSLQLKLASGDQPVNTLSGGNQQKVVLAKWLQRNAEVIIFDEPTRGIDVGAKYEIYLLMNGLAAAGKAIVMISSELPEVLGMADRILVMHEGRLAGEVTDVAAATQAQLMDLAVGAGAASVERV